MTLHRFSLLVAMAKNRVIGINNRLPWHLSDDLKHFKSLTMGHAIVMGRKTYESIGRTLPGRMNVIVTRQLHYKIPGALVVNSIESALRICEEHDTTGSGESFIIGGEELYRQTLAFCQRIYVTEIQSVFEGDAFFPEIDQMEWIEIERQKRMGENAGDLEHHFVVLERQGTI